MPRSSTPLYASLDEAYIARCLHLAELGLGTVSPNPLVGAVVLDAHGRVAGEGYHQRAGEAHAEVIALEQAGELAKGGTLYVNLEPCNHQGRTPPCTRRIIEAGIQRVVCGTLDPNPLVSGAGRDVLQNSRIEVRYGFLEAECKRLNEPFFHYITTRMPFVAVKLGLTLDGKIANRHGESRWLTGAFSRQYVHHLRQQYDAVLTTAETVMADNPRLNVRDIPNIRKQPQKIILDRRFRLHVERYELFKKPDPPVWILTAKGNHDEDHARRARERGVTVIEVEESGLGLNLRVALGQMAEQGIASILVEAGGRLTASLMSEGLANKLYLFYAPKTLTDLMAKPAFGQAFTLDLPEAPQLEITGTRQLEQDWVLEARPCKNGRKHLTKGILAGTGEAEHGKLTPPRQHQQSRESSRDKTETSAVQKPSEADVPEDDLSAMTTLPAGEESHSATATYTNGKAGSNAISNHGQASELNGMSEEALSHLTEALDREGIAMAAASNNGRHPKAVEGENTPPISIG